MKKIFLFYFFLLVPVFAQNSEFDISKYGQYLSSHRNMIFNDLLSIYNAGVFKSGINENFKSADYSDSIRIKFNLTKDEQSLINKNGFVVSCKRFYSSYGSALFDIYRNDLPVYISCDAILHAFHKSNDKILMELELTCIMPILKDLLNKLSEAFSQLNSKYSSIPGMKESLMDIDLYLTVGKNLLGISSPLFYSENKSIYQEIMNDITTEVPHYIKLFCNTPRQIDFSQFKVRGHYAEKLFSQLQNYFKAMIWYGRTEFYLTSPSSPDMSFTREDIQRQIIDAILLVDLIKTAESESQVKDIDDLLKLFTGESDNVTLWNLKELKNECNLISADEILQPGKMESFQKILSSKSYAFQRIQSQIIYSDPMSPEKTQSPSSFLLFGQRFLIDSYITGQVVYNKISYQNETITRMLPSTLDILFSLGNNAALQLLKPELDQYKYSSNLDALRYLIDSYGNDFWNTSIYNAWLNSIRALNPPQNRDNLPNFMQTAAYWQEKINTQLCSWTELRHDNILYGKQPYTDGITCSFPYTYIEPIPSFYENMKILSANATTGISRINITGGRKEYVISYLISFYNTCDTLCRISKKELSGEPFTQNEIDFLKRIIYQENSGCDVSYNGWYSLLYYNDIQNSNNLLNKDFIVTDIHTAPTDADGNEIGWIKHCGTGLVFPGIFIARKPDGGKCAFIGPVGSYCEYTTTGFKRLSDDEWEAIYLWRSLKPSFVNSYMTDTLGNALPSGASLLTGINSYNERNNTKFELSQNFPNPFNPSTNIIYTIPSDYAKACVSLVVYDINGREVKTLLKGNLSPGNYITKWDGRNERGIPVTSGVYFYTLKIDKYSETKRMMLIK
jgi:hypothetical protein